MRQTFFDGAKQFLLYVFLILNFELLRSNLGTSRLMMVLIEALIFTILYQALNRYLYQSAKIRLYFANKGAFVAYLLAEMEREGFYPTTKIGNFIYFEDKASLFKAQIKLEVRERTAILSCPIGLRTSLKKSMGTYTLSHLARI